MTYPSLGSFFDPPYMEDGKTPYGPVRFENIVQEQYIISKAINTSYLDTEKLTPKERGLLIKFILEDKEMIKSALDKKSKDAPKK